MQYITRIIYLISFVALSWAIMLLLPPPDMSARENTSYFIYDKDTYILESIPTSVPIHEEIKSDEIIEIEQPIIAYTNFRSDYDTIIVRALVTACSPEDKIDRAYYAVHGYEGATYNIAADTSILPRGTRMRVPGYMESSFPERWWEVDAAGGSIIRRATRRGILQIDVKYRTEFSARRWGRKWLDIEIQIPNNENGRRLRQRLQPYTIR